MASGSTVIWVLIAAVIAGSAGFLATPKGPNQVLIRTSVVLTLSCTYLMWFIIFMAQLNPILQPRRSDIRFDND
ncbi:H(+)-transporting V0 sector ATPase subunit e [Tilletia horrida]|uniref:H(+)-transporting V0 sector ATPase subunit e n=1 Tax=Tilletia horrida TaxID=155126 RepID=A0AAN6GVS2_9BASI|nr:H(+)-transporting V0 sector ATPase subunit e [Tilletia horrida]KAK0552159.1 H(+)-transporting V0 sector ATPase subunit e [Tilletia horrida]KAK0563601.1 H(+)-transporting V0 sector ATPase subunit e [Tilletia horrida]